MQKIIFAFLAHCIDKYTKLQVEKFQSDGAANVQIDQRLEDIVNRMFQRCFDDKKYKQVRKEIPRTNHLVYFSFLGNWNCT